MSAEVGTDGLVFEAERALNTGDSQDRVFADDSVEGDTLFLTRTSTINAIYRCTSTACIFTRPGRNFGRCAH